LLLTAAVVWHLSTETIELEMQRTSSSCEVRHSTVPDSTVVGDMGVSPIATTAMTGFDRSWTAGMHATTSQVQGNAYGADIGHAHRQS
jgi:hypothetical protein